MALLAATALVAGCASSSGGASASGASTDGATAPAATGSAEDDTTGAEGARTVQPGAPGEATRTVSSEELAAADRPRYSEADVRFMRMMIPHHAQALVMTALIPSRTDDRGLRQLGLRMEISQADEIALMERWLRERGEPLPEWRGPDGAPDPEKLARHRMPGMLTAEQMDDLRAARGVDFERLFLEYMIGHHQGAVDMVATLFASPGGGQLSDVYQFASHVHADQTMEIERMRRMLEAYRRSSREDGRDAVEEQALRAAAGLRLQRLEPSLGGGVFRGWLDDLLPGPTEVRVEADDCGAQTGDPRMDGARSIPLCVSFVAERGSSCSVGVSVLLGDWTEGVTGSPALRSAHRSLGHETAFFDTLSALAADLRAVPDALTAESCRTAAVDPLGTEPTP